MSKVKEIYEEIESVVGPEYVTDKDFMKAAYSRNVDPAFPDRWADVIVRPETTEEVSEIVKIANKYKITIVPRGGGADLVGGSVSEGGILMDLTRMDRIIEINEKDFYCVVECGVTWGKLISTLHPMGLTTGVLGPGSGYSATIGGGLSNSTAGAGSTKYGLVPDICLGVEVVLPNPEGTIIKTGSAANRYAKPFCRYGVSPDFTGLFMGDVGTMGIKTKAFLRLFPLQPYRKSLNFLMNTNDWEKVTELTHEVQTKLGDGLNSMGILPFTVVMMMYGMSQNKPKKRPKIRGPAFNITLEASDERILDIYIEKLNEIMLKDDACREFKFSEFDMGVVEAKENEVILKNTFHYFNKYIGIMPGMISLTTCHKVPISFIPKGEPYAAKFDKKFMNEFPLKAVSLFATVIYVLPNGHCVFVGGLTAYNRDDQREKAMNAWHKKLRAQVRYGGAHYWLGESISQSIVEAGAYTPEFTQFFKDMKKAVDPNFILSPKKFHMYSYDDDISTHIIEDEPYR